MSINLKYQNLQSVNKLFHSILFLAFSFNVFSQDSPETRQRIIRDHYKQILELSLDGLGKDTLPNDRWPMYINGMDGLKHFLQENIKYPEQALKEKIEGTVVLSYVITIQGTIKSIDISESPDVLLSNEVIRVMKLSGPWLPGMIDGSYKAMRMSKSYEFSIGKL